MNGTHRAERPVADVESALIFGGELCAVAEGHANRRTGADVGQRRQAVGEAGGPLAGAAAPAEFAAAGGMVDTRRPVPGGAEIPFHVGVVDKHLAVGIEGEVVGIAIATGPHLPRLSLRIGAHDIAARREDSHGMAVGVPQPRDEQIFVPVGGQPAGSLRGQFHAALGGAHAAERLRFGDVFHLKRHLRVVAADDEQLRAIGGKLDVVWPMLAAPFEFAEFLDAIERVIAVGVAHAIEAAARPAVADDIERIKGPQETLG